MHVFAARYDERGLFTCATPWPADADGLPRRPEPRECYVTRILGSTSTCSMLPLHTRRRGHADGPGHVSDGKDDHGPA